MLDGEVVDNDKFQSTHPLRGATGYAAGGRTEMMISIHAPLAGCDRAPAVVPNAAEISIHAPLAGCDRDSHSRGNP